MSLINHLIKRKKQGNKIILWTCREGERLQEAVEWCRGYGLEFDAVWLIEAMEGQIPYKKAKTEEETEEERRLFYVAMTRAKELLKICYAKTKNGKEASPSRFVEELLED